MHLRIRSGMLATVGTAAAVAVVVLAAPRSAQAVPSYARQTGLACEACHTVYPELTPFGRKFKLHAYTLTTKPPVADIDQQKNTSLSLADMPPLSVMVQAANTWWNKAPADVNGLGKAQGSDAQFPQQLSLFYAGKITDHVGAQFQLTYTQDGGTIGIDNSEIRFADQAMNNNLVYGLTLNNAAGMSDLWNTTPIWLAGANAWSPDGALGQPGAFIEGLGAGSAAGLGAFVDWKNSYYLEVDGYRTMSAASPQVDSATLANQPVIQGVAPYWRAAYERDWGHHSLEFGTFGMWARAVPQMAGQPVSPGNYNTYLDTALDTQYQYIGDRHIFTLAGTWIHENQTLNSNYLSAAANLGPLADQNNLDLNHIRVTGSYFFDRKYGASVSFNRLNGSSDATAFGGASYKNNQNSQYEVFEVDYMPWLNTKLVAQYTMYNWVNGAYYNFNGSNGVASDNNTLMLGIWTAF